MKAPDFWFRPPGWQARLLSPVSLAYGWATARRVLRPPAFCADVPVICVGNINAGGTGKTPTVIALAAHLLERGHCVHIVSRGYGGQLTGPLQVNPQEHDATRAGDEPLLLAAFAPTWIARNRAAGVQAAQNAGADVILLDDGFQNPSVRKDLSIVVVDAQTGFGNGRVIPGGPLREKPYEGLSRADILLSIGDAAAQAAFSQSWPTLPASVPHLHAQLTPLETGMDWKGMRVLAFAGIGRPEKFFKTLRELGADIVRTQALDDHQPLSEALMQRLQKEAWALDAQLVTTEKDAVRLPGSFRQSVIALPVRLTIPDWGVLDAAMDGLGL